MDLLAVALTHHLVDLFESQTSCLRYEEVSPEDTAGAKPAPDEEHFRSEVAVRGIDHVGDDDTCRRISICILVTNNITHQ